MPAEAMPLDPGSCANWVDKDWIYGQVLETTCWLKLADILHIPSSEIAVGLPLVQYGVDSMISVELRNWLGSAVKAKISIVEIL